LLRSEFWLDILYPNRCPACDRVIAWNVLLCEDCAESLPYIGQIPWQALFPAQINGETPHFDYANSLFWYKDGAKNAVLALKSKNGVGFADFAAEKLAVKIEDDGIGGIDLVTAVPMNRRRKIRRGYNQAEIFAEKIAGILGVPCSFKLLGCRRSSVSQHDLSSSERLSHADAVYYSNGREDLSGKNILICDDIFTTGATVDKCCALLKESGAAKAYVLTICRTPQKQKENAAGE
jgi:competence protein ComFC